MEAVFLNNVRVQKTGFLTQHQEQGHHPDHTRCDAALVLSALDSSLSGLAIHFSGRNWLKISLLPPDKIEMCFV